MSPTTELLRRVEKQTTFELGGNHWASDRFRELLARRALPGHNFQDARSACATVPDGLLSELAEFVRTELGEFVDPKADQVGHAFPIGGAGATEASTHDSDGTFSFEATSTVPSFARSLAEATAILGAEQSARLLEEWLQGVPIGFQLKSILNVPGVIAEPLSPLEGLRIESLPLSTDRLPNGLPRFNDQTPAKYLGQMLLSVDHSAAPSLFRPRRERTVKSERKTETPGIDAETVCQALALASDVFAEVSFSWFDFGTLDAFRSRGADRGGIWSTPQASSRIAGWPNSTVSTSLFTGVTTLIFDEPAEIAVNDNQFVMALRHLSAGLGKRPRLAVATSRWLSSKNANRRIEDRFIDVRTALESLYLPRGNRDELRFRSALSCAWHLGTSYREREVLYRAVRDAYDAASNAVHSSDLGSGSHDKWIENSRILSNAQQAVRRGVLKMLEDGEPTDWTRVMLGVEMDADST